MEQRTKHSPIRNNASSRLKVDTLHFFPTYQHRLACNYLFILLTWRRSEALPLVQPAQPDVAGRAREAAAGVRTTVPSMPESSAISPKNLWPNYRLSSQPLPNRNRNIVLCQTRKSGLSRMKSKVPPQQSARLGRKLRGPKIITQSMESHHRHKHARSRLTTRLQTP